MSVAMCVLYRRTLRPIFGFICLVIVGFGASGANAGTLFGFGPYNGSSSTDVWTINPVTGQTTVVATSIGCNPFAGSYSAFDPKNRLLYIAGAQSSGTALCATNLTTGVTTTMSGSYGSPVSDVPMFFDSGSGTLYGFGFYNGSSSTEVWTINPATGQTSVVATSIGCNPFMGSYSAFDPKNKVLYIAGLQSSGTALCTINLTTGVTTSVAGSFGSPVSDSQMFFDTGSGILYGFGFYNGSSSSDVWTINPATGQTTVVATSIDCNPFMGAYSAFDPKNRLLYIAGVQSSGTALCTTNLTTGVTTSVAGPFGSPVSDTQMFFDSGSPTPECSTLLLALGGLGWLLVRRWLSRRPDAEASLARECNPHF